METLTFDLHQGRALSVLVLVLALVGLNVFLALTIGIFSAGIIGLCAGDLTIATFAQSVWSGFTGMNEVFFLALFCGGMSETDRPQRRHHLADRKAAPDDEGQQVRPGGHRLRWCPCADCATANNTVAIIVSGNVARDMSREYKVDPRRTASLLDVFSCVFQGIIPYGAQLLSAAALTNATVTTDALRHQPRGHRGRHVVLLDPGGGGRCCPFSSPLPTASAAGTPGTGSTTCAQSGVEEKKALLEKEAE